MRSTYLYFLILFTSLASPVSLFADWFYWPSEYNALYNEKYAIELELEKLKRQYKNELTNLENENTRLKNQIDFLTRELEVEKREREKDKSILGERIRDLEIQQRILKSDSTNKEKALQNENSRMADNLGKTIEDLRKELEDERKDCSEKMKNLKDSYDKKLQDAEKKIENLQEEIANLRKLNESQKSELSKLQDQAGELETKLKDEIGKGQIRLNQYSNKLVINIDDNISFDSGSSNLKPEILPALNKILEILDKYPDNRIVIEGHTDNVPIKTVRFRNNWQLSSERSLAVLEYFLSKSKTLVPENIQSAALGEFHPVVPNTTKENRSLNRRVDIVVYPKSK